MYYLQTNASQSQTHLATSTATINQGKAIINKNTTTPAGTGVRVSGAVNLATIAGKPMILTSGSKTQGQHPVKTFFF